MKIIALTGVPDSGRAVVSRRLEEIGFTVCRFGSPMKRMMKAAFGITEEELSGFDRTKPRDSLGGHSPAFLLRSLSLWGRRDIHSDLWARAWLLDVANSRAASVVADDLRTQSEADAVRSIGGVVWRVERPALRRVSPEVLQHVNAIAPDLTIINATSVAELHQAVDAAVAKLETAP